MEQKKDPLHSFAHLSPEVETRLRNMLQVQTFAAGEAIFLQGESPEAIYLIASGRVKIVRVTPEGYESILCVRGPGDYFCPVPLLDEGCQLGTAVAMTDVTLLQAERTQFRALCQVSSALLATVQGDCLAEVRRLLNQLEAFAFRSVKERVAIALLDETRRQATDELRLTQQELAGLIGASRERVSRILKELEREGVVALRRGRVILRDRERLAHVADKSKI